MDVVWPLTRFTRWKRGFDEAAPKSAIAIMSACRISARCFVTAASAFSINLEGTKLSGFAIAATEGSDDAPRPTMAAPRNDRRFSGILEMYHISA